MSVSRVAPTRESQRPVVSVCDINGCPVSQKEAPLDQSVLSCGGYWCAVTAVSPSQRKANRDQVYEATGTVSSILIATCIGDFAQPVCWAGAAGDGAVGVATGAETLVTDAGAAAKATSRIAINKAAGDAARDEIVAENVGSLPEQSFNTALGWRRVDVLTAQGVAIESKVGFTRLSSVKAQVAKDSELLKSEQVSDVQWVFTRSQVTGLGGPDVALANALDKAGIAWTIR